MTPDQSPSPNTPGAPRWLLIACGLAALALAASLLYWGYGRLRDEPEEALQSIPAFSGTAESGLGSLSIDTENLPQIGDPAPDFELLDLSGETVRLSDYLGRPVILNFWATWCAPCRIEMPELERAQAEFGDDGPVVLTINQEESAEKVGEFLDEVGLTLPALLDSDAAVGKAYGAFFLPTTVIVDEDGRVAAIHRGMISRDELNKYLSQPAPAEEL
jgi:peroxiredoxin